MGLDMYLDAKKKMYKDDNIETRQQIKNIVPEIFSSGNLEYITIGFEAGYWRKANQIHKWFVDNVQHGKDDCGIYEVDKDDLLALKAVCEKVLEKVVLVKGKIHTSTVFENGTKREVYAEGSIIKNTEDIHKLLPTTNGFFFGSSEYNEYYLDDVKNTIDIINNCLKLNDSWSFTYRASW